MSIVSQTPSRDLRFFNDYNRFARSCVTNNYQDNFDYVRFGSRQSSTRGRLLEQVHPRKIQRWLKMARAFMNPLGPAFSLIEPNLEEWEWLYSTLADAQSRELLVQILAYRAMGHRKVKLPLNNPLYWQAYRDVETTRENKDSIDTGFKAWELHRFNLNRFGYPVQLYARASGVVQQFVLQQYACATEDKLISAGVGDIVIDAGACWGDTALYFATKVGPEGSVLSFEFVPENIAILRRNLALNPDLGSRIRVIERPLWSNADESMFFREQGPASLLSNNPHGKEIRVTTTTVDDVAKEGVVGSIDFIKMDIEGAELAALKGAEATIRRFRPRMAICLYHRLSDFWEIPRWIAGLGCRYEFYIRHFTIHQEETILFCDPQKD
jgi:FkbM family methyltransferase